MSISTKEFGLLKKLMAMTTSDADAEVLMAIRQANAILAKHGLDWVKVFAKVVTVIAEVEAAEDDHHGHDVEAERIENAFDALQEQDLKGGFADFIESLREQWERKRFLTDAQKRALFKAAEKDHVR